MLAPHAAVGQATARREKEEEGDDDDMEGYTCMAAIGRRGERERERERREERIGSRLDFRFICSFVLIYMFIVGIFVMGMRRWGRRTKKGSGNGGG